MSELRELAKFLVGLKMSDVPEKVREAARLCVLDSVGAALGAADHPQVQRVSKAYLEMAGKEGTVTVATEVGNMKGKVRIGSDTWSATSDEPIAAGETVVVESSEGVHVHVRRL